MDATSNLSLPFIMAAQAQKHVTHNEALRALDTVVQLMVLDKDLNSPPGSPAEGARYIVAASPTGTWSGHAGKVAAYQDGAWGFYSPREGWLAWAADEDGLYVWTGSAWTAFAGGGGGSLDNVVEDTTPQLGGDLDGNGHSIGFDDGNGITDDAGNEQITFHKTTSAVNQIGITNSATGSAPQIAAEGADTNIDLTLAGKGSGHPRAARFGVNATADATTKFVVAAAASLFDHAGNGHQHKINKNAAGDTASLLFQTASSGRAEMGTAGDDNFHFKVSADGTIWKEANHHRPLDRNRFVSPDTKARVPGRKSHLLRSRRRQQRQHGIGGQLRRRVSDDPKGGRCHRRDAGLGRLHRHDPGQGRDIHRSDAVLGTVVRRRRRYHSGQQRHSSQRADQHDRCECLLEYRRSTRHPHD